MVKEIINATAKSSGTVRTHRTAILVFGLVVALLSVAAPATAASVRPTRPHGTTLVLGTDGKPLSRADLGSAQEAAPADITRGGNFDGHVNGVLVHFNYEYQWLDRGNSWTFGHARLAMQTDSNLVLYDARNGAAKWASGTNGSGATQMLFQPDDNLVVYTAGYARAVWASNTAGQCADFPLLALQEDSDFVVYCGAWGADGYLYVAPIWATNTVF